MHKYIASFIALIALFASSGAYAQHILVITDSQNPVFSVPHEASVIELDKVQQLEEALSDGLTDDQTFSTELAKTRLNTDIHRELAQAYQGIVDAWALGIQKIPAVVVDRKYVIYGEPDITQAVSHIQAYRESHP